MVIGGGIEGVNLVSKDFVAPRVIFSGHFPQVLVHVPVGSNVHLAYQLQVGEIARRNVLVLNGKRLFKKRIVTSKSTDAFVHLVHERVVQQFLRVANVRLHLLQLLQSALLGLRVHPVRVLNRVAKSALYVVHDLLDELLLFAIKVALHVRRA